MTSEHEKHGFERIIEQAKGDLEKTFLVTLDIFEAYVIKQKNTKKPVVVKEFHDKYLKGFIEDKLFTPLNLAILSQLKVFELRGQDEELGGYYTSLKNLLIKTYFKENPDLFASQLEDAVFIAKTPRWKEKVATLEREIVYSLQQAGFYHNN